MKEHVMSFLLLLTTEGMFRVEHRLNWIFAAISMLVAIYMLTCIFSYQ